MTGSAPQQPATLDDVMRLLQELRAGGPAMGRNGRKILLKLWDAAEDIDTMTGLVVKGEVHRVTIAKDHAPCGCRDGKHTFSRDGSAWFGRGHFTTEEESRKKAARNQSHVVRRTTGYAELEVIES
jgi:hypothetical protein